MVIWGLACSCSSEERLCCRITWKKTAGDWDTVWDAQRHGIWPANMRIWLIWSIQNGCNGGYTQPLTKMAQLLVGSPPMAWKIQGTKSPEPMVLTIMTRGVPAKCPLHSHSGDLAPVNPLPQRGSKLKTQIPIFVVGTKSPCSYLLLVFCRWS